MKLFGELVSSFKQGWSQQESNNTEQSHTENEQQDIAGNNKASNSEQPKEKAQNNKQTAQGSKRGWGFSISSKNPGDSQLLPWNKIDDDEERGSLKRAILELSKVDKNYVE